MRVQVRHEKEYQKELEEKTKKEAAAAKAEAHHGLDEIEQHMRDNRPLGADKASRPCPARASPA